MFGPRQASARWLARSRSPSTERVFELAIQKQALPSKQLRQQLSPILFYKGSPEILLICCWSVNLEGVLQSLFQSGRCELFFSNLANALHYHAVTANHMRSIRKRRESTTSHIPMFFFHTNDFYCAALMRKGEWVSRRVGE